MGVRPVVAVIVVVVEVEVGAALVADRGVRADVGLEV